MELEPLWTVLQDFFFFVLPSSINSFSSVRVKPSVLQVLKVSNYIKIVEFQASHLVQGLFSSTTYPSCAFRRAVPQDF